MILTRPSSLFVRRNVSVTLRSAQRPRSLRSLAVLCYVFVFVFVPSHGHATPVLPPAFTSHMVLQQKTTFDLTGHAAAGSAVTLTVGWTKTPLTATADAQGLFTVAVTTPRAGGPYTLSVADAEGTVTLTDVLVGEVWFCAGQSNMEMPVQSVRDAEAEIAAATYPRIRLYKVAHNIPLRPTDEASSVLDGWQPCSPQTVPTFSALAYFYARELWQQLGVPVGVIDSSWGGTSAEAWISAGSMEGVMDFEEHMALMRDNGYDADRLMVCYEKAQADFQAAFDHADPGLNAECTPWYDEDLDDSSWETLTVPGLWAGKLGTFDGSLWMRREVFISADQAGKDLPLQMGVIDDNEVTWWNGECVGMTEGWLAPRNYVVPGRLVREGRNVICCRIEDTGSDGGVRGGDFTYPGQWRYRIGYDRNALNPLRIPITRPKNDPNYPTVLYNGMVHPFRTFPVQGCIWYQGCNNVGRATQYEALMQTLITDWRQQFQHPDMSFYIVQLANYLQHYDLQPDSEWALLREAQALATQMQGVDLATIIDIGEAADIHPKNKQEVGRRMAALALHQVYGKRKLACKAPVYAGIEVHGRELHVLFSLPDGAEPFLASDDLPGFIIAGADHQWHVAQARTQGDKVIVSSPDVPVPLAVRYGWADNPTCTLHTPSGFPVTPFRSDRW